MSVPRLFIRVLTSSFALLLLVTATPPGGLAEKPPSDLGSESVSGAAQLSDEIQVSPFVGPPDYDNYLPAVAYNSRHHQFLIVWHRLRSDGCREIWARRVTESGQLLNNFMVSTGPCPENHMQPAVAYNAKDDNYLVAWMHNPSGTSLNDPNEILARTVAWDGSILGTKHQAIAWANRSFWTPRVAWNSIRNEYMVVWNAINTTTGLPNDIAHAILDHNGIRIVDSIIIDTLMSPHQVDVTWNVAMAEFFVVWRRMWTPGDGDIMGARLDQDNGFIVSPPGVISISTLSNDQQSPRVATNQQHRYVVVWSQVYDPSHCCDWDIHSQELDVYGSLVGGPMIIVESLDDETMPVIAAQPGPTRNYLAAWRVTVTNSNAIRARYWDDMGTQSLVISNVIFWDSSTPAVAMGGPGFLTTYTSDSTSDPTVHRHVYMRFYVLYTTYLPVIKR